MKKIYLLATVTLIAVMGILVACHTNIVDESSSIIDYDPESPFRAAIINTDAASSEIMKVATATQDTITYYGYKNQDGTTANIYTIEYSTHDGINNIIDLDENGKPVSITNSVGASLTFEWISETSAVVNAHSQSDNYFISTVVDFASPQQPHLTNSKITKSSISVRNDDLKVEIKKNKDNWRNISNQLKTRIQYDPDDYFFSCQEVWLWIYQCSSSYNAKNYIIMKNATNGVTIGKLMNPEYMAKGNYRYFLPYSSYPSSATNKELCANIDNALRNVEQVLSGILGPAIGDSGALIVALNAAAMTTGIGMIPAVITDAIVLAVTAADCGLQLINENGGISRLMEWANSEWYYKEYIISDLILTPVGYTQAKTVMGEPQRVTPDDNNILITLDMQGDPVIDAFTLNPSHPGQEVSYTATADFHCIPEGSTITLSIVGTDGYSNSITESISESGSAVLYVPGAAAGVYDLCNVVINMPFGESLTMQASLVFGQ